MPIKGGKAPESQKAAAKATAFKKWCKTGDETAAWIRNNGGRTPTKHSKDKHEAKCGNWIVKARLACNSNSLSVDRIAYFLKIMPESIPLRDSPLDIVWDRMYKKIREFSDRKGHIHVSPQNDLQLSQWVYQQRMLYRDNRLSQGRIDLLKSISNWSWEIREWKHYGPGETKASRARDRRAKLSAQLREAKAAAEHENFMLAMRRTNDIGTQFSPKSFWHVSEVNLVDASKSHPGAKRNETYKTHNLNEQMDSDCAVVVHVFPGKLNDSHREFEPDAEGNFNLKTYESLKTPTKIWVDHRLEERGSKNMQFEPRFVYGNDLHRAFQWPANHWAKSLIRFLQDERNHHIIVINEEKCEYSM